MFRRVLILSLIFTVSQAVPASDDHERLLAEIAEMKAELDREINGDSIAALPANVVAAKDQLSLFVDFADKTDEGVAVYLVNRTDKPVKLNAQDGDPYLKMEFESSPDNWQRAQPHAFSWCGNSYMSNDGLLPDRYRVYRGQMPTEGRASTVRFSLYNQSFSVHSNVAVGLVNEDDVRKASNDALTVATGDLALLREVALGIITLRNEMDHVQDLRGSAIYELADSRFEDRDVLPVLQSLIGLNGDYSDEAKEALARREEGCGYSAIK